MEIALGILCVSTIALVFITVVGHGIWVVLAAIFKPSGPKFRTCTACGAIVAEHAAECHYCGRSLGRLADQPPSDDIAAAIRQLRSLRQRGLIDATEFERLSGLLCMGDRVATEHPETPKSADAPAAEPRPAAPTTSAQRTAPTGSPSLAQASPFASSSAEPSMPVTPPVSPAAQEVEFLPPTPAGTPDLIPADQSAAASPSTPGATPPIGMPQPASHALERDYSSADPQPSVSRQAIADLLKSFMAEKNIRWGELVSGMLIVGSAVGLVISLRATLSEAIPYFPALIFMLITLGIHGAGLYTLRRWDLRSTSQGVLTIALLLTPLNFLAAIIISGSEERAVTDPMYQLAVAVGIAVVGWVTFSGGRALVPGAWWRLTAVIGATSIGQLIIDRQTGANPSLAWTSALAALPVAGFLSATVSQLGRAMRWHRISAWRAHQILLILGIGAFALLPPLGLLVSHAESLRIGVARIAPSFSLAAAVVLATGLLLHRRVLSAKLAALRTAGTAIAIVGAMLMAAAVVLAWPETDLLITVGLTSFVILVAVAVIGGLPALHIAAVACLALAVLVGFHAAQGNLADENISPDLQLLRAFAAGRSAVVLSGLAVLTTVVAGLLTSGTRRRDAFSYALSTAGLSVVSIVIAAFAGFGPGGDTQFATPVFAFYAIAAMAAAKMLNRRGDRRVVDVGEVTAWFGSGLVLATFVHGLWLNPAIGQWLASGGIVLHRPVVVAFVLHAGICATLSVVFARSHILRVEVDRQQALWTGLVNPLTWSALATSSAALVTLLPIQEDVLANHAAYLFAAAIVWMLAGILFRRAEWIAVFQVFLLAGIAFLVAFFCRGAGWGRDWWADPRHVQIQLVVLSTLCLLWSVRRRISARWRALGNLLNTPWPGADEVLLGLSLVGLVVLSVSACWPGATYELGLRQTVSTDTVHVHSYGLGSWIALAVIALTLLVPTRDRWPTVRLVGLLIGASVVPLLISAHWESDSATASALRWTFAMNTLATAALFWLRRPIGEWLGKIRGLELRLGGASGAMRDTALLLSGLPVVLLTSAVVWRSVADLPLRLPDDGTLFGRMSLTFSFAVPLLTLVAVLLGHALREKRTGYALAGSVLFQYVICLAYMLRVDGNAPGFVAGILQWNAVGLAGYALLWLGLKPWMDSNRSPDDTTSRPTLASRDPSLALQLAATWIVLFIMAVWAAFSVFLTPAEFSMRTLPLGEPASYLAWGLSLIAAAWCVLKYPAALTRQTFLEFLFQIPDGSELKPGASSKSETGAKASTAEIGFDIACSLSEIIAYFALALVAFIAVSVEPLDALRHWLAYHVLSCGWLAVAAALTLATFRWQVLRKSATLACMLVTILALWGSVSDPSVWAPWWSVGTAAGVSVLTVALSLRCRSQWFAYGSIVPLILATSFYWIGGFTGRWPVQNAQAVTDFVQANLIALVFSAILWLLVDLWYQRKEQSAGLDGTFTLVPVHVTVGMIGLILSAMYFVGAFCINTLAREFSSTPVFQVTSLGGIISLAGLGFLLIGALWEVRRSYALPCLYVWGVIIIAFALDSFRLPIRTAFFAVGMAAAAYVMLTGLIWRQGALLASVANSCGIREPVRSLKRTAAWLPMVNLLIAGGTMLATLAIVLTFPERWMRISSGMAPVLLAVGLAALAQKERRTLLEYASLLMTGIAAVCLSWADLGPQWFDRMILLRMIRLLVVAAGLTFIYSVPVARLVRLTESWMGAVRKIAVTFGVVALLSLIAVLLLEATFFEPGVGAPVETPQIAAVAVVLVGLVVGFISLALLPGTDPFTLSDRGRRGYVYAAELVAALIFAHIYLCCPWFFSGRIQAYWPYIVMGIAFAAVAVGEVFRRSGIKVLSEPLQHTSGFLPLLPALGFWVIAAEQTHYATLLFFIGLMYLLLSGLRRSVASGLAAALAGNGALWAMLTDANLTIWNHPQFWLIPPAVSALIAGQINRRRLTDSQMAALRYAAVLVIYLSSTSEIFLQGIGDKLWPPMVLAGLSVAGFFLGIVLRIRSFLVLGASFVLLSVISMVWHAHVAIQHSWPLWAFGIGLGLCILVLFGLFEKQRPQITAWIERIQQWEN